MMSRRRGFAFKWLIYRWVDLGKSPPFGGTRGTLGPTGSEIKALFR